MITDAERDPEDEDTVLVSPQYGLCPECTRGGYDQRPGGNNPPPKTPSRMPTDFEDLPREDYSKFESVSKIPSSSLRPVSPSNASQSRLSSNVYNPGASRVPPPKRPAYASEAGSNFSTQPSQISRESPWSSQSQISNTSQQLSQRPPTTSSSIKPTTATQHPISKIGDPKVSSIAPYPYARTKAPPANEEGPDLDVLLNTPTVMPPSRHSNLSPPGGTAYRAASSSPPSSPSSKQAQQPPHSKRADVARSSASSPSLAQSKAQFPSSLSETPRNSKILPLASSRLQKKNRSKYPPFI
ncbi:hypothetical protein N431DRAFT_18052 [Stipitochalara longipes BDJ]|nr:hypothetical protein N431DRAFT_18052 [Stipitochalara longipes BDJ]